MLLTLCACHGDTAASAAGIAMVTGAIITPPGGGVAVTLGATSSAAGLRFAVQTLPETYPALSFLAELPGPLLQAVTYDDTNVLAANSTVREAATGGVVWVQDFPAAPEVGTFALTLTDAGASVVTDAGIAWPSPHGLLVLTMVATGDVTDAGIAVSVTFPPGG